MIHGSLESGIGMFDYAAEQIGWNNVFHCEINPFCRTILKYYWPEAKSYADVFKFSGYEWRGKVDIITAGFPCQPFSHSGKRQGSKDDRHIWPENMRIFREAQPAFIVCENVPGIITIEDGMVFERVCLDLENEGYEVLPFIIPACAADKYHRRDRIWIVAYSSRFLRAISIQQRRQEPAKDFNSGRKDSNVTDDISKRRWENSKEGLDLEGHVFFETGRDKSTVGHTPLYSDVTNNKSQRLESISQARAGGAGTAFPSSKESWIEAATRLCTVDDGYAGRLDTSAISKAKWRTESLKGAGNTIAWEIAFEIFNAIENFINLK